MIQALIVDDEPMHLEGLARHVRWESLGYAQPLKAMSGEAALAIIHEHRVHVLVTDVSMPGITGIELTARCKEADPGIQVLMVSGYNEFEFVQEAIDVGAQGYVLKPIKVEEIEGKLAAFSASLEKLQRIEAETNQLQEKVSGSLDVVKERFIHDLVEGAVEPETVASWTRLLELPDLKAGIRLVLFSSDRLLDEGMDARSRVMRGAAFFKTVNVSLSDLSSVIAAKLGQQEVLAVHMNPTSEDKAKLEKQFSFIQNIMLEQHGSSITIGVSQTCLNWSDVPLVYKRIKFMMARARLLDSGLVLYENQLDDTDFQNHRVSEEYIPAIVHMLEEAKQTTKAMEYSSNILTMLEAGQSFSYLQAFTLGLISELARNPTRPKSLEAEVNVSTMQQLLECNQASQVRQLTLGYLAQYASARQNEQVSQQHHLVQIICEFICGHLDENITVKQLAEMNHINASYLSVLFKKETGQTISDYIQEIRINRAKELLQNPTVRVYEVAEKVGFQTAAYFAYLFKKITGQTPQEYRNYH